jgi:hypothetical protein
MQNKANVKIGKMNISLSAIKDYNNEQRKISNEHYSKQSQTKPISNGASMPLCGAQQEDCSRQSKSVY